MRKRVDSAQAQSAATSAVSNECEPRQDSHERLMKALSILVDASTRDEPIDETKTDAW